ncbi:helix-turn-helix domain-containing protein [Natronospira bacteriovora]|uniref:Helix-turn-helix domain-containing protein n=1 Tax=Natronospira bacteriovora TaxID=3069753 RepID=A0ABU0W5I2_9GAMM|nr:helix-turn-helix domain-containing protein [Natronospira sp. AB-CW4]MDQ2069281.1 helix-turn-helix domain-containing protein [Natronospira sp. AB-CW4]
MKQQCEVLLKALKRGPMTTKQIRDTLGIGMPATRVFDLKQAGYDIVSKRKKVKTRYGKTQVAEYHYLGRLSESQRNSQAA